MIELKSSFFIAALLIITPNIGHADTILKSFTQDVERDIPIKKQVPLILVHQIGEVSVQGWVQDRIRIKMKKRVIAESEEQANQLFKQVDLLTLETPRAFEMRMGVARGTDLVTKLRAQRENTVEVSLEIKAPYQLDLALILGRKHDFSVQLWKGSLDINASECSGQLSKLSLKGPIQASCLDCNLEILDSKMGGHILASSKPVVLRGIESENLIVDTTVGEVTVDNSSGKMLVHTESGKLQSKNYKGELSFQSDSGGVFLSGFRGKIEAQNNSGQILVEADQIDRLFNLDSQKGDIQVSLNSTFQGKLDLSSLKGEVVVQFPFERIKNREEASYGPILPGRVNAMVGSRSGTVIHAETKQGGIRILRRDPQQAPK